ncbi:hypothetical protein EUX98_g3360 [Antrodiella citrinella]|uniref:Protein kinase domain-containing protein n=1 Tax=Antrodiella citrinella TaxID=2447956 RepID=A0A4S4MYU8_9APHY|nr:hypothetical protein EUX98_g3360 [Antrodiella citrinella]
MLPFLGIDPITFKNYLCIVLPWMAFGDVNHCMNILAEKDEIVPYLRWVTEIAEANALVDEDLHIKLSDFGLSQLADSTTASKGSRGGGTLRWMAPELLVDGDQPDYASDVYAFGCFCLEVYSHSRPFPLLNDTQVIVQVMRGEHPPRLAMKSGDDVPEGLWQLIKQCWLSQTERPSMVNVVASLLTQSQQEDPSEKATQPPSETQGTLTESSSPEMKAVGSVVSALQPEIVQDGEQYQSGKDDDVHDEHADADPEVEASLTAVQYDIPPMAQGQHFNIKPPAPDPAYHLPTLTTAQAVDQPSTLTLTMLSIDEAYTASRTDDPPHALSEPDSLTPVPVLHTLDSEHDSAELPKDPVFFFDIKPDSDDLLSWPSSKVVYGFPISAEWARHQLEITPNARGAGAIIVMTKMRMREICEAVWPEFILGDARVRTAFKRNYGPNGRCPFVSIANHRRPAPQWAVEQIVKALKLYGICENPDWFYMAI